MAMPPQGRCQDPNNSRPCLSILPLGDARPLCPGPACPFLFSRTVLGVWLWRHMPESFCRKVPERAPIGRVQVRYHPEELTRLTEHCWNGRPVFSFLLSLPFPSLPLPSLPLPLSLPLSIICRLSR